MQFIFCVLWFDFQSNTEVLVWKSVQHKEEKFFEITVHLNVAHLTVRSPGNTPCCWAVLVNTPLQHYMRVGYSASGFVNLGWWVQTSGDHTPQPPWEGLCQNIEGETPSNCEISNSEQQCGFHPGHAALDELFILSRMCGSDVVQLTVGWLKLSVK